MRHASILIALLVATPLAADAKPKPRGKQAVKAHMNRATKAHKAGKFEVALTELEAAHALDPQPKLLFAIAQVQAKLDRCDGAIANYEKFLTTTKDKRQRAVVKQAIAACNAKIAAAPPAVPAPDDSAVFRDKKPDEQPPPEPASAPPPPVEATPPAPEVDDAPPPAESPVLVGSSAPSPRGGSPWYKDVLGDVLVVGGLASGVASVIMYTRARGDLDTAETAGSLGGYEDLVDRAHERRTLAVVFASGSAVLIGVGILRYALRGSTPESPRGVALAPSRGGGVITWSGGF